MMIPRIQFIETHEQRWMPRSIRSVFRETLAWVETHSGVYNNLTPVLARWLQTTRATGCLDLCSGTGRVSAKILGQIQAAQRLSFRMCLSDLFPDSESYAVLARKFGPTLTFSSQPVDATHLTLRPDHTAHTIFSAFHHFPPVVASQILKSATQHSDGICIADPFRRNALHLLILPWGFLLALLYPLLSRKFDKFAFLWCWLIPAVPIFYLFDTIVSVLRGYSRRELAAMANSADSQSFEWETGHWSYLCILRGTYLIGWRRDTAN